MGGITTLAPGKRPTGRDTEGAGAGANCNQNKSRFILGATFKNSELPTR